MGNYGLAPNANKNRKDSSLVAAPGRDDPTATPDEEYIRERIWTAIVERKLLPGTRLKEEELNEIFKVGRARIRRILLRLHCERLIELVPNSGAFVAKPTIKEAREIFAARRLIEGELVRTLAARMTDADRAALERITTAELESHESRDTSEEIRLSGLFHIRIAELADSPILLGFLKELIPQTSLIIALYQIRDVGGCGAYDHNDLMTAMAAGDGERAAELMDKHLRSIESLLDLHPDEKSETNLRDILG